MDYKLETMMHTDESRGRALCTQLVLAFLLVVFTPSPLCHCTLFF